MASEAAVPERFLIVTIRQLATLIKAGIPLVRSLWLLELQAEHPGLKRVLASVHKSIEGGSSFSQALRRYPNTFSELLINSVEAGELGGVLDEVMTRLADVMEKDREIVAEIRAAMQTPIMTLGAIGIAIVVLSTFVVPRFASIYKNFGTELPLPTRILIGVSHSIIGYWMLYLPAVIGLIAAWRWYLKTPAGRFLWDGLKLKLPIFGPLVQKMAMARFSAMLATLYSVGLPILQALEVVSRAVGNAVVAREIGVLVRSVKEGKGLAGGMERVKIFPPLVRHMVAIGEVSGSLKTMLDSLAGYYEQEVRYVIRGLTALIEPILLVLTAAVVLILALAIFLPLWGLIDVLKHH